MSVAAAWGSPRWRGARGVTGVLGPARRGRACRRRRRSRAAGRLFPGTSDAAVARLGVFDRVGFPIGSPLVGALGDAWRRR
ncbi:hypothetical protein GCM10010421_05840 [Streptomyces glaucus]|uniref:Secreted protein n=1 Tax=Streptomyces glaucus TaxID=284029 RepID=A0ABN3J798_9ACTN